MRIQVLCSMLAVCCLTTIACGWQAPSPARRDANTTWIDSKDIQESSGLARSRRHERLLWTHNDSGDKSRLFAFDADGRLHAIVDVKDVDSVDWEDMCSFTWNDQPYLAIADVGDNAFRRKHVTIYILPEPEIELIAAGSAGKESKPKKLDIDAGWKVEVTYPNGALNCEAIAYDPWRKQFLLASKEQLRSQLFVVDFNLKKRKQETSATKIGEFPVPLVTGASISDDGRLLVLGTYGPTCLLHRDQPTPSAEARWISKVPDELELIPAPMRKQGESICFDKSGTKLLMTSEGYPTPLLVSELPK
jgi:hypothetical protein